MGPLLFGVHPAPKVLAASRGPAVQLVRWVHVELGVCLEMWVILVLRVTKDPEVVPVC